MIKVFLLIFSVLLSLSFLTLFERKIIGLSQIRLSPEINFINGVIQPFIDAMKLMFKLSSNNEEKFFMKTVLLCMCFSMVSLFIYYWMIFPNSFNSKNESSSSMMFFLSILSVSLYPLIFLSFFSFSKYPYMSFLRSISQSISYEINFSLIIFLLLFMTCLLDLSKIKIFLNKFNLLLISIVFFMLLISIIESFRSPFDFSESESELVSGFSSELGSLKFIFIFLSEYMIMVFYIYFLSFIFFLFFFMFSRSVLPRIRYDNLMNFCWMVIFPMLMMNLFMLI